MTQTSTIKVMVVDDSVVVRGLLRRIIEKEPKLEIISTASDGEIALSDYKNLGPDIVLLDIEMPVMDGITALKHMLSYDPDARIIICSSLTQKGAETTYKALNLGALDCIAKPSSTSIDRSISFEDELRQKLLSLNKQNMARTFSPTTVQDTQPETEVSKESNDYKTKTIGNNYTCRSHIKSPPQFPVAIAIGSSTGGPRALMDVFKDIKGKPMLPIFITQHIPVGFADLLAKDLQKHSDLEFHEAKDGMLVEPGHVYIAPGGHHLTLSSSLPRRIVLDDGPAVNYCKPSIDVMLTSLGHAYPKHLLMVFLTGMGGDGKDACAQLTSASDTHVVLAQDEESSTVWGIPGAVAKAGLCHFVRPLENIGTDISKLITNKTLDEA